MHRDSIVTAGFTGSVMLQKDRVPLAEIRDCGCWIVGLPKGKAILPCEQHEGKVLRAIE